MTTQPVLALATLPRCIKFPKIPSFGALARHVERTAEVQGFEQDGNPLRNEQARKPCLEFVGTVKLHGSNGAVCFHRASSTIWAQSRNHVLDERLTNAGFFDFVQARIEPFLTLFDQVSAQEARRRPEEHLDSRIVALYGEWCGGNVQRGVALTQLVDKMFVLFAVAVSSAEADSSSMTWWPVDDLASLQCESANIYNVHRCRTWRIRIDFNASRTETETQLQAWTDEVDQACPFAATFGLSGPGEGIVWTVLPNAGRDPDRYADLRFKTKGRTHAEVRPRTCEAATTPSDKATQERVQAFVEDLVTEARFDKAVYALFTERNVEPSRRDVGRFIRWMIEDVVEEEGWQVEEHALPPKSVRSHIAQKSRAWFLRRFGE